MMLSNEQRKGNRFVGGCLIPLLTIIGLVGGCFLICEVVFLLNNAAAGSGGSQSLFFFGG